MDSFLEANKEIDEDISTKEIHAPCAAKKLEPLYLKILRNIGLRPYGIFPQDPNIFKPAYLAKRIGVDPKTVKAHLAGMEKKRLHQVLSSVSQLPASRRRRFCVPFFVMMMTEKFD